MSRAATARVILSRRFSALARWKSTLIFFAVGSALSLLAFDIARNADDQRVTDALKLRIEWRAQDFQRKIAIAASDIEAMANYLSAQGDIDAQNFSRFADLSH